MFTGIIQSVGHVAAREARGGDLWLRLHAGGLDMGPVVLGDSIATNGVCLTVTGRDGDGFTADVSAESLACSTLGELAVGARVNLEPALRPMDRLGGHLVSGHVDGVGTLVARQRIGQSERLRIAAPDGLARYIAAKGSICVDGISLTVNAVDGAEFELNIVPHTLAGTTLADYRPGHGVNLEVDLLARYIERLLGAGGAVRPAGGLTFEQLARGGFTG